MPTKPNKAGKPQNYVPAGNGDASGEYGNETGSNKHFTNFKKSESSFDSVNKQRMGDKLSAQVKAAPVEKNDEETDVYKGWEDSILTQERVGNPPEEIKVRMEDTPIKRIDDTEINAVKSKYRPETVDKAAALIRKYEGSVDETASMLEGLADKMGGMMVGMPFRLKRLGSLSRKIESYIIEENEKGNMNATVDDAIANMKDTARFTMMFDPDNFESNVQKTMNELQQNGYKMVKAKNTFTEGSSYKGLNCNFIDKAGNIFELQFHIPLSMQVKEGIYGDIASKKVISDRTKVTAHDIYETTREIEDKIKKGTATPDEIKLNKVLTAKGIKMWSAVPNFDFAFLKK